MSEIAAAFAIGAALGIAIWIVLLVYVHLVLYQ